MLIALPAYSAKDHSYKVISPIPKSYIVEAKENVYITLPPKETVDTWVDKYANKYGTTPSQINRIKVLLHFLLLKEAGYGSNKNCGDSGLACGPLQFHEPTYKGFRKIMMQKGLVKEMGSRLDMENAIETTAWAISDGRENNWGPVLRGEIKL